MKAIIRDSFAGEADAAEKLMNEYWPIRP